MDLGALAPPPPPASQPASRTMQAVEMDFYMIWRRELPTLPNQTLEVEEPKVEESLRH